MKKITGLIFFLFVTSMLIYGQDSINPADTVLPPAILKDFAKRYPKGEIDDWIKDGANYVISTFASNLWLDVTYSMKGKWMNTATLIDYDQLPKAVITNFESSAFKEYEVVKVSLAEAPKTPKVYKLYIENLNGDGKILHYNESGTLLSSSSPEQPISPHK